MTETKTKLKRCPCCGGMAAVRQEQKPMEDAEGNFGEFTIWQVACLACGMRTAASPSGKSPWAAEPALPS